MTTPSVRRVILKVGKRVFVTVRKEMRLPKDCDQLLLWDDHFVEVTARLRGSEQKR
jgi:hypothetical protein